MAKTKDIISNIILDFIYQADRLASMRSISRYVYYDYYKLKEERDKEKEIIKKKRRKIQNSIYYLKKKGLIEYKENDKISLTRKGFLRFILDKSFRHKPKKNNVQGEFYIVIFDIPENLRYIRNLFRKVLYNFSAEMIQRSVFLVREKQVYEYLKELSKTADIKDYVKFIVAYKMEK